ncbi:MAG: ABC transporter substrate-binding protein [Anaerolineae bacterium]
MKRIVVLALAVMLVLSMALVPASAQDEAPEGVWYGTWPYTLLPEHHLNGYAAGGLNTNLGNVFRGMVELTPAFYIYATNEWVPLLAESWGFSDDSSYYELTLQEGLTWSNGSPINADDVITTYALGQILGWSQFNFVESVEKVDDLTVNFNFIEGQASLLAERLILKEYIVATDTYGELAAEALALIEAGADPEGDEWTAMETTIQEFRPDELIVSGPYTYSLDDVGDTFMTLSWQPNSIFSDSVNFGEIVLWAGETESSTPLVLSGEIAHATNVYPPATVQSFVDAGIEIVTIPRGYGPGLLFNHTIYPWNVVEVRQAMAYVIDRDQNAFLTNGLGATGTVYMAGILDSVVPTLLTDEAVESLNRYERNLEEAEALMEAAGFSRNADGIWEDADGVVAGGEYKFPAEFADFAGASQDAISQLNEFGFDIVARAIPWQENAADLGEGEFELTVWSWGGAQPYAERNYFNPLTRWDDPGLQIDLENYPYNGETVNLFELIIQSSAGLDVEAQRAAASEASMIINETMPYIPLNVIISAEPFNTNLISGLPEAGDPILSNPTGSDHFIILGILQGTLSPGPEQSE